MGLSKPKSSNYSTDLSDLLAVIALGFRRIEEMTETMLEPPVFIPVPEFGMISKSCAKLCR